MPRRSRRARKEPPEIVPRKSDEDGDSEQNEESNEDDDQEKETATIKSEASETSQSKTRRSKRARRPTSRSIKSSTAKRRRPSPSSDDQQLKSNDSSGVSGDEQTTRRKKNSSHSHQSGSDDSDKGDGSSDDDETDGSKKTPQVSGADDEDDSDSSDNVPLSVMLRRKREQADRSKKAAANQKLSEKADETRGDTSEVESVKKPLETKTGSVAHSGGDDSNSDDESTQPEDKSHRKRATRARTQRRPASRSSMDEDGSEETPRKRTKGRRRRQRKDDDASEGGTDKGPKETDNDPQSSDAAKESANEKPDDVKKGAIDDETSADDKTSEAESSRGSRRSRRRRRQPRKLGHENSIDDQPGLASSEPLGKAKGQKRKMSRPKSDGEDGSDDSQDETPLAKRTRPVEQEAETSASKEEATQDSTSKPQVEDEESKSDAESRSALPTRNADTSVDTSKKGEAPSSEKAASPLLDSSEPVRQSEDRIETEKLPDRPTDTDNAEELRGSVEDSQGDVQVDEEITKGSQIADKLSLEVGSAREGEESAPDSSTPEEDPKPDVTSETSDRKDTETAHDTRLAEAADKIERDGDSTAQQADEIPEETPEEGRQITGQDVAKDENGEREVMNETPTGQKNGATQPSEAVPATSEGKSLGSLPQERALETVSTIRTEDTTTEVVDAGTPAENSDAGTPEASTELKVSQDQASKSQEEEASHAVQGVGNVAASSKQDPAGAVTNREDSVLSTPKTEEKAKERSSESASSEHPESTLHTGHEEIGGKKPTDVVGPSPAGGPGEKEETRANDLKQPSSPGRDQTGPANNGAVPADSSVEEKSSSTENVNYREGGLALPIAVQTHGNAADALPSGNEGDTELAAQSNKREVEHPGAEPPYAQEGTDGVRSSNHAAESGGVNKDSESVTASLLVNAGDVETHDKLNANPGQVSEDTGSTSQDIAVLGASQDTDEPKTELHDETKPMLCDETTTTVDTKLPQPPLPADSGEPAGSGEPQHAISERELDSQEKGAPPSEGVHENKVPAVAESGDSTHAVSVQPEDKFVDSMSPSEAARAGVNIEDDDEQFHDAHMELPVENSPSDTPAPSPTMPASGAHAEANNAGLPSVDKVEPVKLNNDGLKVIPSVDKVEHSAEPHHADGSNKEEVAEVTLSTPRTDENETPKVVSEPRHSAAGPEPTGSSKEGENMDDTLTTPESDPVKTPDETIGPLKKKEREAARRELCVPLKFHYEVKFGPRSVVVTDNERVAAPERPKGTDRSKLSRAKALLYSTGSKVHRGRGFERIFADYWDAVSLRIANRLSSRTLESCERAVKAFLKTARLRKIHNKFILRIIRRAATDSAPIEEVLEHIPTKWHHRVANVATVAKDEGNNNDPPLQLSLEALDFSNLNQVTKGSLARDSWEEPVGKSDSVYAVEETQRKKDAKAQQTISSSIPGALAIDPLVRKIAEENGMQASDNAVWLLVVALKEHSTNVLKAAISQKESLENGEVPSHVVSFPKVLATTSKNAPKKDSSNDLPKVPPLANDATKRKCLSVLDVYVGSSLTPAGQVGSVGGSVSRNALERCLHSSFQQEFLRPDIADVKSYLCEEIAHQAQTRKTLSPPVQDTATSSKLADLSAPDSQVHRLGAPPTAEPTVNQQNVPTSERTQETDGQVASTAKLDATSPAVPADSTPPPRPAPEKASAAPADDTAVSNEQKASLSAAEIQKQGIRGMGRGAKNLAALMRRSAPEEAPSSQGPGTSTTTISDQPADDGGATTEAQGRVEVSSVENAPPKVDTSVVATADGTQDAKEGNVVESTPGPNATDGAVVKDPTESAPPPVSELKESPSETDTDAGSQGGAAQRRGKGFGIKNLAAMRARSTEKSTAPGTDTTAQKDSGESKTAAPSVGDEETSGVQEKGPEPKVHEGEGKDAKSGEASVSNNNDQPRNNS